MELNEQDIIAVAKDRVKRTEKNYTYWVLGGLIAIIGGWLLARYVHVGGYGLTVIGAVVLMYYFNKFSSKQKQYSGKLLDEWDAEQEELEQKGKRG